MFGRQLMTLSVVCLMIILSASAAADQDDLIGCEDIVPEELEGECPEEDPFCVVKDLDGNCIPAVFFVPLVTHAHAELVVSENGDDCTVTGVDLHVRAKLPLDYYWELDSNGDTRSDTEMGPLVQQAGDNLVGHVFALGETVSISALIENTEYAGDSASDSDAWTCGDGMTQLLPQP